MTGPGGPDVRVRFAPDGQDAVVRAVQAVATQLQTLSGKQREAASASSGFTGALGSARSALAAFGVGLGAVELLRFTKDAIEAAAQIHELSEKTGIGAEQLSILSFAAKQSGTDLDGLTKGLRNLGRAVGEALRGNQDVALSFDKVGLSLHDLQALPFDQIAKRVLTSLAGVPEGTARADVALHLFGKAGTDLLPLAEKLAGDGFDRIAEAARNAGAVMSGETTKSAQELKDAFSRLGSTGQGAILKLFGDGTAQGAAGTVDTLSRFVAMLGDLFGILNKIAALPDKLPWKSGAVNEVFSRLFSRDVLTGRVPLSSAFSGPAGPVANILAGAGVAAPTRASSGGETFSKAEVEDLAKLLELGAATTAERTRALAIEKEIRGELLAGPLTLTRHLELAGQLNTLEAARLKSEKAVTDEIGKQALEREAEAARERLRAIQKQRDDAAAFEAEAARQRLIAGLAPGHFADFADLFARGAQTKPFQAQALAGLPQPLSPSQAEAQLAVLRELLSVQDQAIKGDELLGQSLRDAIAGDLANFFADGITQAQNFGEAITALGATIVHTIQSIVAQLLAAQIVQGIASILGLGAGIPAAPTDTIAVGPVLGLASGGVAWGGRPGRDSVPALLTPGEGVLSLSGMGRLGGSSVLHDLNSGGLTFRGFGAGGIAGSGLASQASSLDRRPGVDALRGAIDVTHDPSLILTVLEGSFLRVAAKNRRELRDLTQGSGF